MTRTLIWLNTGDNGLLVTLLFAVPVFAAIGIGFFGGGALN